MPNVWVYNDSTIGMKYLNNIWWFNVKFKKYVSNFNNSFNHIVYNIL